MCACTCRIKFKNCFDIMMIKKTPQYIMASLPHLGAAMAGGHHLVPAARTSSGRNEILVSLRPSSVCCVLLSPLARPSPHSLVTPLVLSLSRRWHAVDVWSAGCVLAELELLRPLFPGRWIGNNAKQHEKYLNREDLHTSLLSHWPSLTPPGKTVPDQLGLIMDVMGAPSEVSEEGCSEGWKERGEDKREMCTTCVQHICSVI